MRKAALWSSLAFLHSTCVLFRVRINVLEECPSLFNGVHTDLCLIAIAAPSQTGQHGLANASRYPLDQSVIFRAAAELPYLLTH